MMKLTECPVSLLSARSGSKAVSPFEHPGSVPFNDRFLPFKTYCRMIGTSFTAQVLRQAEREAGGLLCDVGGPKIG